MIEIYLIYAFNNQKENDQVRLLPIAKFAYNILKNISIDYILFKLNYSYYPQVSFEDNIDP